VSSVNISAKFDKDTSLYNGLGSIAEDLIDNPHVLRTAVVTYETSFSKRDFQNGGVETPTIRIVQIEPLSEGDAVEAKALQAKAFKARTGNALQDDLFSTQNDDGDEG